jgi:hypothetical protein
MKLNVALRISVVALAFALVGSGSAFAKSVSKPTRDWTKHPAVVEVDTNEDVFAISDAHADYTRLAGVLVAAKIIGSVPDKPKQVVWIARKSVLVIVGDMIDKWKHSVRVIELIRALQKSAAAQGGQVIATMGNHEAEFLADPTGKKTKDFSKDLIKHNLQPKDVANCKGGLGQFLCQLPIAARVNDWFFCHGGNTDNRSIKALTSDIQAGFTKDGFATEELIGDNSILEARLNKLGPNGLPWFDDKSLGNDPRKLLTKYVASLGVRHIVQGHQPGKVKFPDGEQRNQEDMFQRYGLLFLIDTGMSRGIAGSTSTGGALRITGKNPERAFAICANGKEQTLWDHTQQPPINARHCGK